MDHEVRFAETLLPSLPVLTHWNQYKRAAGIQTQNCSSGSEFMWTQSYGKELWSAHVACFISFVLTVLHLPVLTPLSEAAQIQKWKLGPRLLIINVLKANKICIFPLLKVYFVINTTILILLRGLAQFVMLKNSPLKEAFLLKWKLLI